MAVHPVEGAAVDAPASTGRLKMIGYFAQVPHTVARDTSLAPGARLLYVIVQGWTQTNGWCYQTLSQLADDYGASERQVQRLLDELVERELLREQPAGRGRRKIYAPLVGLSTEALERLETAQHDKYVVFRPNTTEMSSFGTANTTFPAAQHDIFDGPNTTFLSPVKEETPVEPEEEKPGTVATQPAGRPNPAQLDVTSQRDESISDSEPASPKTSAAPPTPRERAGADPRVDEIWDYYRQKIQPRAITCARTKILARLKTFSVEQIKTGIDHFAADWWSMENNASRGTPWWFESDARVEHYLLMTPRTARDDDRGRQHARGRPEQPRPDASIEEINATRHGYSGSSTGPIDPELLALVERRFDRKQPDS